MSNVDWSKLDKLKTDADRLYKLRNNQTYQLAWRKAKFAYIHAFDKLVSGRGKLKPPQPYVDTYKKCVADPALPPPAPAQGREDYRKPAKSDPPPPSSKRKGQREFEVLGASPGERDLEAALEAFF